MHVAAELSAGRLSPDLKGIFYSQPGPDAQQPGEPLFSQPEPADVEKAIAASVAEPPITERVRQAFEDATTGGNLKDTARRGLLYTITLRHIAELGGKLLPTLKGYVQIVQQMATDRTQMQEDAAAIADRWDREQRKDRQGADNMANLAHDATIAGVDPDAEYKPLTFATFKTVKEGGKTTQRRVEVPVNRRNIDDAVKSLKLRRRTADDATKKELTEKIAQLEERLAQEQKRTAAYPALLARWQALPDVWKKVYREARDAYTVQSKLYEEALVAKIEAMIDDGKARAGHVASIRQQFEAQRVEGPYFPLARFGKLYIAAKSPSGEPVFSMYENVAEWKRAQAEFRRRGYTNVRASEKISEVRPGSGPSSAFMADLMDTLGEAGVDDNTKDAVYQLYLRSLPDLSIRKSFIHRKKTAGYSKDALRAFAGNLFHGSYQIARLRYSHHLDASIDAMKDREKALRESDPDNAQKAAVIIKEMERRNEWVMNPQDSAAANALTSLGFMWYLGISPAAAIVNLTQVPIMTFPVLAARFGSGKASAALLDGMNRAVRNVNGDIARGLSDEERRAFKVWYESGAIDKTLTHSLAGLADSDTTQFSPVYRRTMEIVSFLFHKAEVVNREASALAAFRLARESGMDFQTATQYANDVVWETQFDYSAANRARLMQGNVQKVLFMFRQYSLNMTWFLWRNLYNAIKDESPQVRRDAQRKLAGVMGMTTLFAGTLGLPMVSVAFGVANAAAAAFSDDEEPWDSEIAFRNFLADNLGPDTARLITGGAVESATGIEISSRVSLNELWYRSPDRELEGAGAWAHVLETIAGPVGGIFKGVFATGPSLIEEGHVWRGIEAMVPKFIRDGMRSIRYTNEGVNTLNGMPIISDLTLSEEIAQLSGFGPSRLAERHAANNAAKNFGDRLAKRRERLLNALAMAVRTGDQSEVRETMERIRKWNADVPALAIDRKTIDRSLAQRARYRDRAVSGVVLDRRIEQQALALGRFAEGG